MNKLMGFFELRDLSVPSIPWREFDEHTRLDDNMLWTVRTAVFFGNDLNLPRKVGVCADEAMAFGKKMLNELNKQGMVIYYPYFVAVKSGNLNVFSNRIIIEAVNEDLWNLVTLSDREVTIIDSNDSRQIIGNEYFLTENEIEEIEECVSHLRRKFNDDLLKGKSVLLEWSFAKNCNKQKEPIGQQYLVFYEVRTV